MMPSVDARELIVLSDLHLGRGKNPRTGRFHRLEAFFHDAEFEAFCAYLIDDARRRAVALRMIIAGDAFDLLRVDDDRPADADADAAVGAGGNAGADTAAGADATGGFGANASKTTGTGAARRGEVGGRQPLSSPAAAAALVEAIVRGHPGFVAGLAKLIAAGHDLVFLPGNHDIELQWRAPQQRVRAAIAQALTSIASFSPEAAEAAVAARLSFAPWFYQEPGRIWIEHGSQYDHEGAFRYPLRGADTPLPPAALERDFPLGNFFQRYLFNGFGATAFIVPSSDASERYVRWMLVHRPGQIARTIARHVPFIFRYLVRLGRGGGHGLEVLAEQHRTQLARLAVDSELGQKLEQIDVLKDVRTDVAQAAAAFVRQTTRFVFSAMLLLLFGAGIWYLGVEGPQALDWGFWPRLLSYLGMSALLMIAILAGSAFLLLRPPAPRGGSLAHAAARIAAIVDVPIVIFGHTHGEDIAHLRRPSGDGWYFNSGTWIAVFTRDVLLPRPAVQLSYVRVRGGSGELVHFDPARGAERPVVLLDDARE
jgi:UDP-2,3-diacylglucosamine pyrophosphatase LpxH